MSLVEERVLSVERTRHGFALHLLDGPRRLSVRKEDRRVVEAALRSLGLIIVDEYGCRIDQSQFDKEADPSFNYKVGPGLWAFYRDVLTPNWYLGWRHRRYLRQSSDDA